MDDLIPFLQTLPPELVYLSVFGIALAENIFPPLPSDLVVVFAGSLVAVGQAGFSLTLLSATAGSTVGFLLMFKVGVWFGTRIVERGKVPFLPLESIRKVEAWFAKYGYWIIVANRFLAGTRAVVSFFAGLSGLSIGKTTGLSIVSALVWNMILLGSGYLLGRNWQDIGYYLSTYAQIITALLVMALLVWIVRTVVRKPRKGKA